MGDTTSQSKRPAKSQRRLRVLVLTHPDLVPPSNVKGINLQKVDWRTDYDVVRTLKRLGHEVQTLGVYNDLGIVRKAIYEWQPHIAYNLLDEFNGEATFDQNVVSYLELMQKPYTGCNPKGLILSRDKSLTKKLLAYHRVPVPFFAVFPRGRKTVRPDNLSFPLIVKSLTEQASLGISQASLVQDDKKLQERVQFIHDKVGTDAIVEQYIDGREVYVGVLGNGRVRTLPVWELVFRKTPDEFVRIATHKVKWNADYRKKYGITTSKARNLPAKVEARIEEVCRTAYRVLGMTGYARMDLRVTASGDPYLLEANPNPDIGYLEDFAQSAEKDGIKYPDLISQILQLGLNHRPA